MTSLFSYMERRPTDPDPPVTPDPDSALASFLPRFAGCTVLVLGDVMLDRYVLGEVRRISPEAPIPVLHAQRRRSVPGGAGNVAQNIASLGARAVLVGMVGADAAGDEIGQILARLAPGSRPGWSHAGPAHHREDPLHERRPPVAAAGRGSQPAREPRRSSAQVLAAFDGALATAGAVVISDYAKGLLTDTVLAQAIALRARRRADGGGRPQAHRPLGLPPCRRADAERRRTGALHRPAGRAPTTRPRRPAPRRSPRPRPTRCW